MRGRGTYWESWTFPSLSPPTSLDIKYVDYRMPDKQLRVSIQHGRKASSELPRQGRGRGLTKVVLFNQMKAERMFPSIVSRRIGFRPYLSETTIIVIVMTYRNTDHQSTEEFRRM